MQKSVAASGCRAPPPSPFKEVRGYILFGIAIIATMLGGLGVWAASVDISGAVLAAGSVVVDSSVVVHVNLMDSNVVVDGPERVPQSP